MNIALIGFMGTGKTTVGKRLARALRMRFVDTDYIIEERAGIKISEIFSSFGEPYFRELERNVIAEISARDGLVISAGGGAVLNPENIRNLKRHGKIVCLTARPEAIYARIKHETHRPLLNVPNPSARIRELLNARAPYYAQADITIDTTHLSIGEVVAEIRRAVGR